MAKYLFNDKEHVHLLDDKPLIGTSTACKIISKPLTWWASGMAVATLGWKNSKLMVNGKYKTVPAQERLDHAAKFFEELKGYTLEQYINKLDEAYGAHNVRLKDAAADGTDLHAELEKYVKNQIAARELGTKDTTKYPDVIKPFVEWAKVNVDHFLFSEIHCYSEKYWLGGIVDAGAVLKDGARVVIDFKSAKAAYFDHFIQIALYDIQLMENGGFDKNGKQLMKFAQPFDRYLVVPFGSVPLEIKERYDIKEFREAAIAAVTLYRHSLRYEN
jgi:hypothetical protein